MKSVFVYGTLMFSEIAERVLGFTTVEIAELKDYRRYKIQVGQNELPYPAIKKEQGAVTKGKLFRNLTDTQIHQFDEYEGVDYHRETVAIETTEGGVIAEVYVWNNPPGTILSGNWDPEKFEKADLQKFLDSEF